MTTKFKINDRVIFIGDVVDNLIGHTGKITKFVTEPPNNYQVYLVALDVPSTHPEFPGYFWGEATAHDSEIRLI